VAVLTDDLTDVLSLLSSVCRRIMPSRAGFAKYLAHLIATERRAIMETYRTLAGAMSYADMRDSIPPWAQRYAVGDTIYFEAPEGFVPYLRDGDITSATIAGFSSSKGFEGLPVVVSSSSGHLISIPEHRHVDPMVGGQHVED
jgi:hypothetical protein